MQKIGFPLPEGKVTLEFQCGAKQEEYRAKLALLSPVLEMIFKRDQSETIKIDCDKETWNFLSSADMAYLECYEAVSITFYEALVYLKVASQYGMTRLLHILQRDITIPALSDKVWQDLLKLYDFGATKLIEKVLHHTLVLPKELPGKLLASYINQKRGLIDKEWLKSWCMHNKSEDIVVLYKSTMLPYNEKLLLALYIDDVDFRQEIRKELKESPQQEVLLCYHCNDICKTLPISKDGRVFCSIECYYNDN